MEVKTVTPTVEELIKPAEKNLTCIYDSCGKTFQNRQALNMHLAITHKLTGFGDFMKKTEKVTYLCPVKACSRSNKERGFPRFQTLKQHYINIHSEKSHGCNSCEKRYATAKQLFAHMESCGQVFICSICHTPYASKQTLLKHQQSQHSAAYKAAKQILASASSNQLSSTDQANGDGKINNTVGSTAHQPISSHIDEPVSNTAKHQTIIVLNIQPEASQHVHRISNDTEHQLVKSTQANAMKSVIIEPLKKNNHAKRCSADVHVKSAKHMNADCHKAHQPVRLLPKPLSSSTTQTQISDDVMSASFGRRESSSTQTDIMHEAVRHSGIISLSAASSKRTRDVTTMTDDMGISKKMSRPSQYKRTAQRHRRLNRHSVRPDLYVATNQTPHMNVGGVPILAYHHPNQLYPPTAYSTPQTSGAVPLASSDLTPYQTCWDDDMGYQPPFSQAGIPQHQILQHPESQPDYHNSQQSTEFDTQVATQHTISSQTAPHMDLGTQTMFQTASNTDLGTQTMFQTTSNTDLGTQTMISAILEGMNSSSIELQCELGNQSLVDGVMSSFGTQTFDNVSECDIEPSISQIEMSSFGTQTGGEPQSLQLPNTALQQQTSSYEQQLPPHQSTSDFAMQFPYDMMDFGTQTPMPSVTEFSVDELSFDEADLVASEPTAGGSVMLSQSSTQTDLEYLLNSIQTQTDTLF